MRTNKVTPDGGLRKDHASDMKMEPNLLPEFSLSDVAGAETSSNTGTDNMTSAHMRNWMECVRNRNQPDAGVRAGYNHSIANIYDNRRLTDRKICYF